MAYTIKDVAREANVSIATVSRILNGQPGYSKKTKEKVLRVIEEMGYHPNAVARGLINKRTHTIGVMFPYLTGSLVTELLRGIESAASRHGSSIIVCHTGSDREKTKKYLKVLNEKRVDGIIFTSEVLEDEFHSYIDKMNVPLVLLSTKSDNFSAPYVRVNDEAAAYSAAEYLIKQGHTKLGMISGREEDIIAGQPRINGFLKALKDYGISLKEGNVICTEGFGFPEGITGLKRLLENDPGVTGIFAASDEMAIGAISAAHHCGIKVPDDISIIGYDNIDLAQMSIPPLTTVAQPFAEMGETAGEMLLNMLETGMTAENRIMPHRIIERMSVKRY
ncbi:LacI family DNA-binding transcriptional regulator [Peribacillus sp. SCS-37]|uniref:LacI family DNA-binding transcriptional regulator n=1 Tax=Paraperibacillus esterisolvens TaxID=3115296 RepID=UPI00390618ED